MIPTGRSAHLSPALLFATLFASVASGPAALSAGSAPAIPSQEATRIEKEIRDLEERFNRSYERNDMNAYWAFYADDNTQLWDNGRITLEQYKKDWTALLKAGGGVQEIKMEDVKVQASPAGDAAVGSYRIFVRMKDAKGKETSDWYNESDVWFRRAGSWKIVYLHYSHAGPSPLTTQSRLSLPPGSRGLPFQLHRGETAQGRRI